MTKSSSSSSSFDGIAMPSQSAQADYGDVDPRDSDAQSLLNEDDGEGSNSWGWKKRGCCCLFSMPILYVSKSE